MFKVCSMYVCVNCTIIVYIKCCIVGLIALWFCYSDQSCDKLFCSGGWEFPVTSRKSFYKAGNGDMCNEATMNPEDNYPADLGMVPTGTKCGNNMVRKHHVVTLLPTAWTKPPWTGKCVSMYSHCECVFQVCYEQRCQDMKSLKVYGTDDCSAKCNNHGVRNVWKSQHTHTTFWSILEGLTECECYLWQICNHERKCHCDPGWAPPFCDMQHSEMPEGIVHVLLARPHIHTYALTLSASASWPFNEHALHVTVVQSSYVVFH